MWLTVKETADLLGITDRGVRMSIEKYCKGEKYVFRCVKGKGRGGKQYEILLESLPKSAQTNITESKTVSSLVTTKHSND